MRHLCESGLRENRTGRLSGGRRPAPWGASSDPTHQQMTHPVTLVLDIVAGWVSRERRQRRPHLAHTLLGRLIHADHRVGRIIRAGVHPWDLFHGAHEGGVLLGRNAPHLLAPRFDLVFFGNYIREWRRGSGVASQRHFNAFMPRAAFRASVGWAWCGAL